MLSKVIITIAVTVAVLAVPISDPRGESNGIPIPLTKYSSLPNSNKRVNTDMMNSHVASHVANIIHWIKSFERGIPHGPHPSTVKRDGSPQSGAGLDLTIHGNSMWYGTISIGTPAKSFTVQFDTGSSDLFVPASTGDENCRSHHNLLDPASSTTAKALNEDFDIKFADGSSIDGKLYTDNVTIAGFTADVQTFGAATTYSSNMAAPEFAPDGILGLAFPSHLAYPARPLFHTLFKEGKIPQPVFSLMLAASGGELYAGGTNKALYMESTLSFTPVTHPVKCLWQLEIDNIKVNNQIVLTDVPAIIDTGSNYISGDPSKVFVLHQTYGGKAFGGGSYYTFPCSSFPSVTFTIGGKPYLIPAHVLNLGQVAFGSRDCFSGIMNWGMPMDQYNSWVIGTIFLKRFYTVFDFGSESPRVGFAKLARMPIT